PRHADDDRVFSKKAGQFFNRQPLPPDHGQLISTVYLQEILNPLVNVDRFSAPALKSLRQAGFVSEFRDRIRELEATYGTYESIRLASVWQSNDGGVTSIYRYRVTFSKNKAMDFRLLVKHSRVTAFYFYHPWRQDRPL
ncbi:MAG: hypothetical protein KJO80_06505, partial [Gammaproteobacteria bacterium]|nr:hypothetical protein [Gammaproteobacteria bacterium]